MDPYYLEVCFSNCATEPRSDVKGHFRSILSRPQITSQIVQLFSSLIKLDDLARGLRYRSEMALAIAGSFVGAFGAALHLLTLI
ncbi:hypothetical protein J6590_020070 [Homalodisca vitripennis]|nr:hypothetical protein J6590_020070 [Homalodisca vitripennis]